MFIIIILSFITIFFLIKRNKKQPIQINETVNTVNNNDILIDKINNMLENLKLELLTEYENVCLNLKKVYSHINIDDFLITNKINNFTEKNINDLISLKFNLFNKNTPKYFGVVSSITTIITENNLEEVLDKFRHHVRQSYNFNYYTDVYRNINYLLNKYDYETSIKLFNNNYFLGMTKEQLIDSRGAK